MMQINPLGPALGAEILGLDLTETVDENTVGRLTDAFFEHQLLCFRSAPLQPKDFAQLSGSTCKNEPANTAVSEAVEGACNTASTAIAGATDCGMDGGVDFRVSWATSCQREKVQFTIEGDVGEAGWLGLGLFSLLPLLFSSFEYHDSFSFQKYVL